MTQDPPTPDEPSPESSDIHRIQVGERVVLGEVDVHVAGIVRSAFAGVANLAFVHLDQLSLARRKQGSATQFLVTVNDGVDPEVVAGRIDERFLTDESRTDTKNMQAFVAAAVGEIAEVVEFARWLGYLAVLVTALVLANTVTISAESRIGEMAVLETVGMTKPRLMGLIVCEGTGLGFVGGALGTAVIVGLLVTWPLTLGVEGYGIDMKPDVGTVVQSLLAAAVIGVVASVPPALAVARRPLAIGVKEE